MADLTEIFCILTVVDKERGREGGEGGLGPLR